MITTETLEERAFRLLQFGSITTPNIHVKPIMIPVVPFNGGENKRLVHHIWPLEYSSFPSSNDEDYCENSFEERLDLDSDYREHQEYMGDRENIVTIEDVNAFDRMLVGYSDDHVAHLPLREEKNSRNPEKFQVTDTKVVFMEDNLKNTGIRQEPVVSTLAPPVISFAPLQLKKSLSEDTEVSSVFSSSSTITTSTPAIMKLKARKRLLERFLSDKSLGSTSRFNETYSIMEETLPGSVQASC